MAFEKMIAYFDDRYGKKQNDVPRIVFGRITSVDPIELRLTNVQDPIPRQFIRLSGSVRPPIGEGLAVGDRVTVLKANGGQLFYVMDKE